MDPALDFAVQLARQTGQVLVEGFRASRSPASLKADHSVVTAADLAADQMIYHAVQRTYPDDLYLSEELRPKLVVPSGKEIPAVWVVDPIDGTTNFSLGLHIWGVLVVRLIHGRPEVAAMYFPLLDEMFTAQREGGAYLNGQRVQVLSPESNGPASFFACCTRTFRNYQVNIPFKPRILGSTAYNLCCVGRSIAVIGFEATPKIWDIAGAWLFVREAGGWIETYDGSQPFPVRFGTDYSEMNYPILAAATQELVTRWRPEIQPRQNTLPNLY